MTLTATIPSRSQPDVSYTVTIDSKGATSCTCPAGQHALACWHARVVRAEWERQRAGQRPSREDVAAKMSRFSRQ